MIGDVLVNRFRLEERLGGGAQGEIYRARDLQLSRWVAIKMPTNKVDEDFVANFKREAKLLVKFEHANVVTLHDFYDPDDGMPFLVMEYLQGQPLDARLKDKSRPLTRTQLRAFAEQICGALHKAHEAGLIHRDIKPSNVMLVDEGKRSERFAGLDLSTAKSADFAPVTNPTIMSTQGEFSGTIAYMSPEQLEGGKIDYRSDIYSFGTTIYQILTGKLPFQPPDNYAGLFGFMQKVVRDNPPPLREAAPEQEFSDQLEQDVMDCMAKKATDRPDSMQTVSQRLLKSLPQEIVPALADTQILTQDTIPTLPGELQRPAGSRYWSWAIAAAVLVLGGLWIVYRGDAKPTVTPPPPPTIRVQTKPLKFKIRAGDTANLTVTIDSDVEGYADLQLAGIPGITWEANVEGTALNKRVHVTPEGPQTYTYHATAAITASPGAAEAVTTKVTIEDSKTKKPLADEQRVSLDIQGPRLWLQDVEGFECDPMSGLIPHPQNEKVGPGHKVYLAERIERVLIGEDREPIRIPFHLIHRGRLPGSDKVSSKWPVDVEPFYMMENKVHNQLVLEYGETEAEGFDAKAWVYLGENAANRPEDGQFAWLLFPQKFPDLPAMNLKVEEAERIARWLTAGRGTLPRQAQWDVASGLYDGDLDDVAQTWPEGPYLGRWNPDDPLQIAINRTPGAEPPAPVGTSLDDVSPYGCRDMAGNGWEFTADVYSPETNAVMGVVPLKGSAAVGEAGSALDFEQPYLFSRGQQYFRNIVENDDSKDGWKSPLQYDDLQRDNFKEIAEVSYPDRNPAYGFRAIIPID